MSLRLYLNVTSKTLVTGQNMKQDTGLDMASLDVDSFIYQWNYWYLCKQAFSESCNVGFYT